MVIVIKKVADELKVKLPDLITRPIGKLMYRRVSDQIRHVGSEEVVVLDFDGIKVIDASFIDEFLLRLMADSSDSTRPFFIKLRGVSEAIEINIDSVLHSCFIFNNEKKAVATDGVTANNSYFIGKLSPIEKDIVNYLRINKSAMVHDIAAFIDRDVDDTARLLEDLNGLRVIRCWRERDSVRYAAV